MQEARKIANSMELDLVEIQGNIETPIIKICNYEKMVYELKKSAKKNKQATKPLKEIQLSVNIAKHDLETKANNARKFIEDGSRVRVILSMKGREMSRREENKKSILEFVVLLEDVAVPEAAPRDEGNKTVVILKRKNNIKQ
jgi:translation initiation factor IF-3